MLKAQDSTNKRFSRRSSDPREDLLQVDHRRRSRRELRACLALINARSTFGDDCEVQDFLSWQRRPVHVCRQSQEPWSTRLSVIKFLDGVSGVSIPRVLDADERLLFHISKAGEHSCN